MLDTRELLQTEIRNIDALHLKTFNTTVPPLMGLGPSNQTLWIRDYPLPDGYDPDSINLVMIVDKFPVEPPKGVYLLASDTNRRVVQAISRRFNVFRDKAFHGAPPIAGYEWICVGYMEGWRYNPRAPHRGDNIAKMLDEFQRGLEEVK